MVKAVDVFWMFQSNDSNLGNKTPPGELDESRKRVSLVIFPPGPRCNPRIQEAYRRNLAQSSAEGSCSIAWVNRHQNLIRRKVTITYYTQFDAALIFDTGVIWQHLHEVR